MHAFGQHSQHIRAVPSFLTPTSPSPHTPMLQSKQPPLPSLTGTRVVTEAGQQVELFDASKQAAGFVKTVGQVFEMFEIVAVASAPRCNVTVLQIGGVLAGPKLGQ